MKYREFWITDDNKSPEYYDRISKVNTGEDYLIHVIEYAAYEKLQKQIQIMRGALEKVWNDASISNSESMDYIRETLEKLDER